MKKAQTHLFHEIVPYFCPISRTGYWRRGEYRNLPSSCSRRPLHDDNLSGSFRSRAPSAPLRSARTESLTGLRLPACVSKMEKAPTQGRCFFHFMETRGVSKSLSSCSRSPLDEDNLSGRFRSRAPSAPLRSARTEPLTGLRLPACVSKMEKAPTQVDAFSILWRRGESNPCPKITPHRLLRV